jgi:hypothetical protein
MNDPVFFECAETLGVEMRGRHGRDEEASVREMFVRCLGREPGPQEMEFLQSVLKDLSAMKAGESKEPQTEPMIAMARIIMNLDEFITRD